MKSTCKNEVSLIDLNLINDNKLMISKVSK